MRAFSRLDHQSWFTLLLRPWHPPCGVWSSSLPCWGVACLFLKRSVRWCQN